MGTPHKISTGYDSILSYRPEEINLASYYHSSIRQNNVTVICTYIKKTNIVLLG